MRKNIIILLLSVATLASLLAIVQQHRHMRGLREDSVPGKVAMKPGSDAPSMGAGAADPRNTGREDVLETHERKAYRHTIDRLRSQLEATQTETEPTTISGSPTESPEESSIANFPEMLQNPEMKVMIRAQCETALGHSHGSLLKYLELSSSDMRIFRDLLVDKQMAIMDLGFDTTHATMEEKERRFANLFQEYDEKIRTFLNDDNDFRVFKDFEDSEPERMQVAGFRQSLGAGDELDDEQEYDLLATMYAHRTNFSLPTASFQQQTFYPSGFSEQAITTHLNELAQLHGEYIASARQILSDAQLAQFENNLEQDFIRQETAIRLAMKMIASPPGTDNGA